jgi:hypothetical protein
MYQQAVDDLELQLTYGTIEDDDRIPQDETEVKETDHDELGEACFGVSTITDGAEFGVHLNVEKSAIYQPNHLRITHMLPADLPFERGPSSGLLGAPICNLEFCSGALEKTVAKVNQAHSLLTEMDDPQVELLLLRACLGSGKMTYLNRVIPTHTVFPYGAAFDVSMKACLARITQGNICDAAWSQAGLPLAMGGLRLTHKARICSAAFISSSNMTTELAKNLVIQDAHTTTSDPALPKAIEHYDTLMASEVGDLTMQTQSTLTLALHSRARVTLLPGAELRNKAPLLSLTLPQAHSWLLLSVPYKSTL